MTKALIGVFKTVLQRLAGRLGYQIIRKPPVAGEFHRLPKQTPSRQHITRPTHTEEEAVQIVAKFRQAEGQVRLHLGCGRTRLPKWLNVDIAGANDLNWDLAEGLSFVSDNTVDFIFHEHVLEHLERPDAIAFTRECYRSLKPGGVIRIAMPDLDEVVRTYQNGWKSEYASVCEEFRAAYGGVTFKTRGELLDICMRGWGHCYLYNEEDVCKVLAHSGFQDIRRVRHGISSHEALTGIEQRPAAESSLVVEGVKHQMEKRAMGP